MNAAVSVELAVSPSSGASRHLLPVGEKSPAVTLASSSPHRGEGGSRSEPGEEAYPAPVFAIAAESPADVPAREALLDRAIGPNRRRKSSEKLRRGRLPSVGLAFVARDGDGAVIGTVRLWDVKAGEGGVPALLLGPLAVDPAWKDHGIGSALMRHAIAPARGLGHGAILLVGDAPYYARFGFSTDKTGRLAMPGPYERHRLLALELVEGTLESAAGVLRACGRRQRPTLLVAAA